MSTRKIPENGSNHQTLPDATLPSGQTTAANSRAPSVMKSTMAGETEKGDMKDDGVLDQTPEVGPHSGPKDVPISEKINPMDPSQYPDGGPKAWLVVLGGFFGLVVSFGWINCIGVFQEYYQGHQLRNYTSQEIAWIPSLEGSMMFFGGLWIGRIYDNYGPTYLLLAGTFFHVFGLMMASISSEYYQFILSQGLCSPIGTSMIFYPCMSATSTWFFKRRALALGIVATGSSIGGVIFPIMVERLIPEVGFGWTMRICAFMILGLMGITILTVRSRLPPMPRPVQVQDFVEPFKEAPFSLLAFGNFLTFLGIFLPFTFIIVEGRGRGVSDSLAKYLVAILNATSTFGRTLPNYLADKFGRFTVFLISCFLTTITVLAIWLPTSGTGAIVTFTLLFGFTSGAVVSLVPALIAQISPIQKIGVRTGVLFSITAIAVLIGSPIGGQLIHNDQGKFKTMQGFSGAMLAAGFLVQCVLYIKLGGLKKLV